MKYSASILGLITFYLGTCSVYAQQVLDDESLREVSGQAAFYTNYIPTGGANPNANIGFFTLGLEGKVDLNANIEHLQLGCGGVNGPGCDIDLTHARLSGVNPGASGTYADSDATLTNPFLQIAIQNPTQLATRSVAGIRFGAQGVLGMLSIGENPNTSNLSDDTGINSLSGDIGLNITNAKITNACATLLTLCVAPVTANLNDYSKQYHVIRGNSLDITGLTAVTTGVSILGVINLPLGITLNNINIYGEPLRAAHQLVLAGDAAGTIPSKDVSLSLQNQSIKWQKGDGTYPTTGAEKGWWINLPNLQVNNLQISQYIPIDVLQVVGNLLTIPINLDPVDLGQSPTRNCYGTLKFC
ncbi:hypothetical protein [Aquirhabdus sp.]|uniref:hypothetical protein n=1 Tax=Aquirhabdus sp. TaxID=2824160 RepID=UPI00396C56F0